MFYGCLAELRLIQHLILASCFLVVAIGSNGTYLQAEEPVFATSTDDKKSEPSKVRLVTSLSDLDVSSFKNGQRLQTWVPHDFKDRLGVVTLRRDNRLNDDIAKLNTKSFQDRGILYVEVSLDIVERLAFQIVELAVQPKSSVQSVVFVAVSGSITAKPSAPEFNFRVQPSIEFAGSFDGAPSLSLKTEFATVKVPIADVASIHLASKTNGPDKVVFTNGDFLSGKLNLQDEIAIDTKWGVQTIESRRLISIKRHPRSASFRTPNTLSPERQFQQSPKR